MVLEKNCCKFFKKEYLSHHFQAMSNHNNFNNISIIDAIEKRHSCRQFLSQKLVKETDLKEILKLASRAPSGGIILLLQIITTTTTTK